MPLITDADPFYFDGGNVGVLLVHGFTGSPRSMKDWGRYLADAGYTVSVPRLPGHGTSWQEMNKTRWEDWYGEAERELRDLSSRCSDVFVMGLSMGGSLALRLAEQNPDIAGVVVVNAAVHTERPDRHLLPFIRHVVPAFPGITNDIKKPGVDEGGYTKIPLQAAYSLQQLWSVVKRDIAEVKQPLLVMRSAEDHVVEASNTEWILDHVASDDVTFVELENSYHVATMDYDAPLIFAESEAFMKRLATAAV
ncbi:MAG: alpha/beta fold hydrolase [Actinobacteria bacterium]|nr:alpha/beta fold hydrolase [Actinomycetota bacterium]MCB9412267.1 alpha/beta fold hydrolase [Actinomycetota bacterium]